MRNPIEWNKIRHTIGQNERSLALAIHTARPPNYLVAIGDETLAYSMTGTDQ